MIFALSQRFTFPDPRLAEEDGLLAVGGDLHPDRIMAAYRKGIFPWYAEGDPILWWSPEPRLVLFPSKFKISASLKQTLKSGRYRVTRNACFNAVIEHCSRVDRKDQEGTWITSDMKKAYLHLHQLGHAHSYETWQDERLVGGLYGISLGNIFCGESMFYLDKNASKVALASLVESCRNESVKVIDCQVKTEHMVRMGAEEISREDYLRLLKDFLSQQNPFEKSVFYKHQPG